ncbi:MAG: lysine--tRNA ligase [Candidatus Micrarchaeia archaeon]
MEGINKEDSRNSMREFISSLPYSYNPTAKSLEIKSNYEKYENKEVDIAGRIMGIRKSGKLIFMDVQDSLGKIQCFFSFDIIKEEKFEKLKTLNIGDIIGVKGKVFKTDPGEISVKAEEYTLLSKALRMLPDKWHGLQDVELRYRKRYLDLIMNPSVKEIIRTRSRIIQGIRDFLNSKGFIEVETPTIQPLYGGADAEPFKTKVNFLNEEDYLRISDELYLKRLIIGGMEKVYEICKDFRNEDLDVTHSPEFTMIEWYQAYADYNDMMNLYEELLAYLAKTIFGKLVFEYGNFNIDFTPPFKRVKYVDSLNEKLGLDILSLPNEELFALAEKEGIKFEPGKRNRSHAYDKLFEKRVQPELIQPSFVVDFPRETSPLTRPKRGNPKLVERFEMYVAGVELANSYSELNNPIIQRENFEAEVEKAKEGDKEAEPLDMDFVEAMEYGMPPTGGLGLGIDRLVMMFTNKQSIKEVIPFPMLKRI